MKIWQRHLFNHLAKTFFLLLFCVFTIYLVVDLSIHGVRFLSKSGFTEIVSYYFHTLATLLDLFLTLTFLLATLRVLFDLNASRELLALQMAGISKKKLLTPFFIFAFFLSAICYINSQWFVPEAQDTTYEFKTAHKSKKNKTKKVHLYSCVLEDESELVYQSFSPEKKELFDVFWIRNPNDIWHMKYFQIDTLQGEYVNHLTRNQVKQFENSESFVSKKFPELPWNDEIILHRFIRFENRPIATLFQQGLANSTEQASILSHFYYKLLTPLIPFLILLTLSPIAIRYSRNHPLFFVAAAALFSFIALKVILDGMLILGENQALPSFIAMFSPFLFVLALSIPNFVRMR